jgi:hypothetical protein
MLAELRRQGGSLRNLLNTVSRTPEQDSHLLQVAEAYQTIISTIASALTLQDEAE